MDCKASSSWASYSKCAIADGEDDPEKLANFTRRTMKRKNDELELALRFPVSNIKTMYEQYGKQTQETQQKINVMN